MNQHIDEISLAEDGTIWFSYMFTMAESLPYTYPLPDDHDPMSPDDPWVKTVKGIPQGPDFFPTKFYWKEKGRRPKPPGHLCRPDVYIVSEQVAEVFRNFDLGQTQLYPTRFFEFDQKTPLPGQYYCLAIGETKRGIIIEKSRTQDSYPRGTARAAPSTPEDGDLVVRKSALDGADIWVDSEVHLAPFLSGRLVQALRVAKLDKPFYLTKCIVPDE